MKTIPAFTIVTLIYSPALASESPFADSTSDFGNRSEISNTDPSEVHITKHTADGSGCPEGTVDMTLTPDGGSLSILFREFFIETPIPVPGSPQQPLDTRISCEINIALHIPEDKALRLARYQYRGAVYPAKACPTDELCSDPPPFQPTTILKSSVNISGIPHVFEHDFSLSENIFDNYDPFFTIIDTSAIHSYRPSDCGKDVNIRSLTSLEISGYDGNLYLDSAESTYGLSYEIEWFPCEL